MPLSINITLRREKREEPIGVVVVNNTFATINYDNLDNHNNFSNFVEDTLNESKKKNGEKPTEKENENSNLYFHVTYWMFYPYSQVLFLFS